MNIRIVKTPPGEAPEEIRKAWVGVVVPLPRFSPLQKTWTSGVVSGPRSRFGFLIAALSGRLERKLVYQVSGREAVDALAAHSPQAAAWWRQYAPHVLRRGSRLGFPADVCEEVRENDLCPRPAPINPR